VDELRDGPSIQRTARIIEQLSRPATPLPARQLSRLFTPKAPIAAQVAAARICAARQDPRLLPLMFEAFLASKTGRIAYHPDIFERLLRGISAFPPARRWVSLVGPGGPDTTATIWQMIQTSCKDTAGEPLPTVPAALRGWLHALLKIQQRGWIAETLALGDLGLNTLRSDSGNEIFRFLDRQVHLLLGALVAHGGEETARAAASLARRLELVPSTLERVRKVLRSSGPTITAAGSARLASLIGSLPSRDIMPEYGLFHPLALEGPPAVDAVSPMKESPLAVQAGRPAPDPVVAMCAALLGVAVILLAGMALLARKGGGWRRWSWRLAAMFLPVLLLLPVAEGVLALAGVQPLRRTRATLDVERQLLVSWPGGGKVDELRNRSVTGSQRVEAFRPGKPNGALRVFTFGGSSVFGLGYTDEEIWPRVMQRRLAAALPARQVEVINGGYVGATSDFVFNWTREVLAYKPDLLVYMLGYNDHVDDGRMLKLARWSPKSLRTRFLLERWRVVRLVYRHLGSVNARLLRAGDPMESADNQGGRPQHLQLATLSFEENLSRAAALARREGVRVILVLQGQNEQICGEDAALGSTVASTGCFPRSMRETLLQLGPRLGVPVVDPVTALRRHAAGKQLGYRYFYDTIHPSALTHTLIGESVAPVALELLRGRGGSAAR